MKLSEIIAICSEHGNDVLDFEVIAPNSTATYGKTIECIIDDETKQITIETEDY